MSKRAWGAPREAYDPDAGGSSADSEEDAPRRRAPAPKRSGSFAPITRAFGLVVLVFGLWTIGRRWKWVDGALDLHRVMSGTREMANELAGLSGLPAQSQELLDTMMPTGFMVFLMGAAGVLGILAGVLMAAVGALVVFQSALAIRPGARGLLAAAGAYTLAHGCDVWLAQRTIAMREEAWRQMTEQMERAGGMAAAMVGAYADVATAGMPSLSDVVIDALFWVVPVCVVLVWGWRHLESPDAG